eukprot:7679307-Pyramimonas_sp.AAC.1
MGLGRAVRLAPSNEVPEMSEEVGPQKPRAERGPSPTLMSSWTRLSTRSFDVPKAVRSSQYGRAMGSPNRRGAGQAFDVMCP